MRLLTPIFSLRVRRDRDESGAIAILVAGGMVALLVITAMLLDFGLIRMDRQQNKLTADAAATAGAIAMTSDKVSLAGACAARDFLKANNPDLAGMVYSGQSNPNADPCTTANIQGAQPCVQTPGSATPKYDLVYTATNYRVQITTPYVLPSQTNSENYASLNNDKGSTDGCDQIRVLIQETRKPGLGSLATTSDLITQVASVARGIDNPDELLASVAVLLERTGCAMSVSGNGGQFHIMYTSDRKQPGFLHSDSDGSTCSQQILTGQQTSPPGIFVEDTPTGTLPYQGGIIQTRSPSLAKAVDSTNKVVAKDTTAVNSIGKPKLGPLVGRLRVDQRYRTAVIREMRAGVTAWNSESTIPISNRYDICAGANAGGVNNTGQGNGDWALLYCSKADPTSLTHSTGTWTIARKTITVNYSNIVLDAGSIGISGNSTNPGKLLFPNAEKFYMTGTAGTAISVGNNGTFQIGRAPASCIDNVTQRTYMVVGAGGIASSSGGVLNMCHTAVMMLGGVEGNATTPPGCVPDPAQAYVWPNPGTCNARINLSGTTFWSAPNERAGVLADSTLWDKLEDLAYWNESTDMSQQGSQVVQSANASLTMSGLFFSPNSQVDFGGNSNMTFTNAQFIARIMTLSGSAMVTLTPNEYEMVLIPASTASELMR